MEKAMSLLAGIGLLFIFFGGMVAADGQELATLAVILPGITMTLAGALLHDRILARKGLLEDTVIIDGEDNGDEGRQEPA